MVATQTVDATVTIPEGTVLMGELVATCVNAKDGGPDTSDPAAPRPTVASIAKDLNADPSYNTIFVQFTSATGVAPGPIGFLDTVVAPTTGTASAEATASTPWYLTGSATTEVSVISASVEPITYGDDAYVTGDITGPTVPVEVRVYGVPAGAVDEQLLATGTAELMDGSLAFAIPVSGLTSASELRLAIDGGPGYTPAEAFASVSINGRVRLSASSRRVFRGTWVLLTTTVAPGSARGTVKFQFYDARDKKWRTLASKRLARAGSSSRATCWWRPKIRGSYKIRSVYSGDWDFGGATSSSLTVKVR
jgi:hypothetical protein